MTAANLPQGRRGGTTWVESPLAGLQPVALDVLDAEHGWLLDARGVLHSTVDGGQDWAAVP